MPRHRIGSGLLLTIVLLAPLARAAETSPHQVFTFTGISGERYGRAAVVVGDVDGDGVVDLAIGAPMADGGAPSSGRIEIRSGATGLMLASASGDDAFDRFGAALAGPGDLDGDGVPDVVVGAPAGTPPGGQVIALSGAGGSVLWSASGAANGDRFGHALDAIGDVDGDGFVDVGIGSPDHDGGGFGAGRGEVRSGASGALVWSVDGAAVLDRLGSAVAGVGDVDADGTPDVGLGAPLSDVGAFNGGAAFVRHGRTGAALSVSSGVGVADQLGFSIDGAGDVDGDGRADVVVGVPAADAGGTDAGRVEVHAGDDGALLLAVDGAAAGESFGFVAGVGDVDGDGVPDVAAGAPSAKGSAIQSGVVRLHSGSDGSLLATLAGASKNAWFGNLVERAGDIDGDGIPELLVGAPGHDDDVEVAGTVALASSRPRLLVAGAHTLSAASGGTIPLALRTEPPLADGLWILLGSTSGTAPPVTVGGLVVPLVGDDPYFSFRLAHPTAPPLSPALGFLDAAGRASAAFILPPNVPPVAIGTTVHHAAIVAPNGALAPGASTPAVPISILP